MAIHLQSIAKQVSQLRGPKSVLECFKIVTEVGIWYHPGFSGFRKSTHQVHFTSQEDGEIQSWVTSFPFLFVKTEWVSGASVWVSVHACVHACECSCRLCFVEIRRGGLCPIILHLLIWGKVSLPELSPDIFSLHRKLSGPSNPLALALGRAEVTGVGWTWIDI